MDEKTCFDKAKDFLLPALRRHNYAGDFIPAYDYEETNGLVGNLIDMVDVLLDITQAMDKHLNSPNSK